MITSIATEYIAYETKTCGRCLGTGRYSYNQMDGDTCFSCRGKRTLITKPAAASKETLRAFMKALPKPVSDADRARAIDFARTLPGIRIEVG